MAHRRSTTKPTVPAGPKLLPLKSIQEINSILKRTDRESYADWQHDFLEVKRLASLTSWFMVDLAEQAMAEIDPDNVLQNVWERVVAEGFFKPSTVGALLSLIKVKNLDPRVTYLAPATARQLSPLTEAEFKAALEDALQKKSSSRVVKNKRNSVDGEVAATRNFPMPLDIGMRFGALAKRLNCSDIELITIFTKYLVNNPDVAKQMVRQIRDDEIHADMLNTPEMDSLSVPVPSQQDYEARLDKLFNK